MCMIAYQPKGLPALSKDVFDNAWSHNDDGAGIAYIADGKMVIEKPFFKLKALRKAYMKAHSRYGESSPILVHFRWATHGTCNAENTHPHMICGGKIALVHNGILPFDPPKSAGDISDTVWFCRTVLNYRVYDHLLDTKFKDVLEDIVGANKLVLLGNTGEVSIINEDMGTWDNGVWYSNTDFKTPHIKKVYTPISYSGCTSAACTPMQINAQRLLFQQDSKAGGNRIDEWDNLPNAVEMDGATLAAIRDEWAALEVKATSGDGMDLKDWDRYEILCDILDEAGGADVEAERERNEWAEYHQFIAEGKHPDDLTEDQWRRMKAFDTAIRGDA